MSSEQYLAWEATQAAKHEFVGGEVFAMTGARLDHNRIAGNAFTALREALRGRPCEVFIGDVKVEIAASGDFVYPDVVVTCDPRDLADGTAVAVAHPWLVVEVLSESTAAFDRGRKFELYRTLPSLTHYLLVEQTRPYAELFRRNEQGQWVLHPLAAAEALVVERPHAFELPVAAFFEGVRFDASAGPAAG